MSDAEHDAVDSERADSTLEPRDVQSRVSFLSCRLHSCSRFERPFLPRVPRLAGRDKCPVLAPALYRRNHSGLVLENLSWFRR
jgi:hypothetical protein